MENKDLYTAFTLYKQGTCPACNQPSSFSEVDMPDCTLSSCLTCGANLQIFHLTKTAEVISNA